MPIYTLEDLKRPQAGNPKIGRRFTDLRPKPAPPKTKPTEIDKVTTRKAAKKPAKIATSEDHDNDDGDDYYVPSEYDQDSDSDASSIMSVDAKDMGDGVQEKLDRDGKVIRTRGQVKDYALVEEAVKADESFKKAGLYFKQQFKALLAEQYVNAKAEVDDPNVPTVECDLQGPNDDVEASFGLQRAPDQTREEFLTSMTPDYVYKEGNKIYSPAYKKSIWKEPHKGKDGTVEWRATEADLLYVYPDGSIALRRRFDLETSATEGMRPNKRKRVEEDGKEETE
ncbi:hypothetical protein GT037_009837 [Alternaria burnsii]|uniref:Uncharacterized protein n=1 Tax=Alternaria burnsii TaxID=1187904 RepID=A0A8H7AWL1_9PLEO|nr:uncharacterized protein GT037_009837 [Alternaria burnsii]KAF7671938.1 hypothetical protein GT037_009837 [Alternaria burnsii]CAI9629995.1 unnamed protein product [Alternaria burnsii]